MYTWFQQHLRAFSRALKRLLASPLNTLLSMLVIGIAITLPAAGYAIIDNVQALGKGHSGAQQISIFMELDASSAAVAEVRRRLKTRTPGQWRFVPRDEAFERLKNTEGMAEIISSLPRNPLPDAFILEPEDKSPDALEALRAETSSWPGIAHTQLDSAWIKRFDAFLQLGRQAVHLLALVFAVGLIAVTFNTIRLQVFAQAEEIEVARLIGATDAFIRRPFYYFGLLQGVLGGVAAVFLLFFGLTAIRPAVTQLTALYGSGFVLHPPGIADCLALIAAGGALGWVGAQLSVSLALRQQKATQR
ncbi:MAG: permease-like cell division protein FtsX [Zoogloeaceae bacterium]|jgi:cell division transport system permease protein|nr:permease-like cell division protein FtsX [Zoogloeaceae bacterium]